MLQDLAALAPPAIVCVAVLAGVWALVRKELAPKRRARARSGSDGTALGSDGTGPGSKETVPDRGQDGQEQGRS